MRDPLGVELERTVPASERHGRGQYFTPDALVDLVLSLLPEPAPHAAVMDPSCGSGRFLLAASERWASPRLAGYETDHGALEAAREQLPGAELSGADFLQVDGRPDTDLVIGNPPYLRDRGRKRDAYVDFVEQASERLRPGGRVALVLSGAWLDVGYGLDMRRLLQERFAVEWIVESSAERWFEGASVNTMVLVARRGEPAEGDVVRFATVDKPLPAEPRVVRELRQDELPLAEPWGPLLRASPLFFAVRRRCVTLGELASVSRGWTTNDNRFFYPPADSGIEERWLRPLAKGPKRLRGVRFGESDLRERAFVCGEAEGGPGAHAWIAKHGRTAWTLRDQRPARLFLVKGTHDRHRHLLADAPVQADQQLYMVRPEPGIEVEALAGILNCSWSHLCLELGGRVNFGDGVLWLGLADARSRLHVPDLRGAERAEDRRALADAFAGLPDGPVPPASTLAADPAWGPAVEALDAVVGRLLGLDRDEQEEVRELRRRLCARRLRLAASGR